MSEQPKLYVAAVGMITPVGANAEMTAAAVRAGVSRIEESRHYNKNFNSMKMALVPEEALSPLNPELVSTPELPARQRRMLQLATPALAEVLGVIPVKEPVPVFLAVPESIPGVPSVVKHNFLTYLYKQTGAKIDIAQSRIFATGRAGGIQAIEMAFKYLQTGKDVVMVGGVDTYLDDYLLSVLDADNRISAEGIMDGFIPGEAAGFLLLVSDRVVAKLPTKPLLEIFPPGISNEAGHRYSEDVYKGDGLAQAVTMAIGNGNGHHVKTILSSINGENFSAKEFGVAITRNSTLFDENFQHIHPADCFGDIGAAFAPVLIGLAALKKNDDAICFCSSEKELRAAVSLAVVQ